MKLVGIVSFKQKIKKSASFLLAFMLTLNGNVVSSFGAEIESGLYKGENLLKDGDSVALSDELTWRVVVSNDDLAGGVTITLPDGVLPNIEGSNIDGMEANADGNKITISAAPSNDFQGKMEEPKEENIIEVVPPEENGNIGEELGEGNDTQASDNESAEEVNQETGEGSETPSSDNESGEEVNQETGEGSETPSSDNESAEEVNQETGEGSETPSSDNESAEEVNQESQESDSTNTQDNGDVVESNSDEGAESEEAGVEVTASRPTNLINAALGIDEQEVKIPVKIDESKVQGGNVNIAGINLLVSQPQSVNSSVQPTTFELLKKSNEQPIRTGDTISKSDEFLLQMTWASLENVVAGDFYEYQLPDDTGTPPITGVTPVYSTDFPSTPFANLIYTENSKVIKVEFLDMGKYTDPDSGDEYDALSLLRDANVQFECSLAEVPNASEEGKITLNFPTGSVTVTVSELVPKPPQLNKSHGVLNEKGEVEWTITYTHPVSTYKGGDIPDELVDSLP